MARFDKKLQSPETAMHATVTALGGLQNVGVELRPEYEGTPDTAGRWLSHCLNDDKRDKLSLRQIVRIFHRAAVQGDHDGFQSFAAQCGYDANPVVPHAQLIQALQAAVTKKREAQQAANDLQTVIDNPRLIATLKAAGVNVEALT